MAVEYPDGWSFGEESFRELFFNNIPFLVSFTNSQCGPCFRLKPQLKRLVKEIEIPLVEINMMEESVIYEQYEVEGTPAVLLIKGGQVLKTWLGYNGRSKYIKDIEKLL